MNKTVDIETAFKSWDNHLKDCKATILVKDPQNPEGPATTQPNRCRYDGEKCPNGMRLYNEWRKALGEMPIVTSFPVEA